MNLVPALGVGVRSLRHPDFRRYYLGQLISLHGTWMQAVAQAWLVYRLTNSSFMLGLVSFFNLLPVLLLGLLGGVTADRLSRRRLLLAANFVAMMQALLLGVLTLAGWIAPWHVVLLAALLGVTQAFEMPARHAFITEIVPRADLSNAIALNSSAFNVARFIGPAIAGWLVALYGEGTVFFINALSFGAILLALGLIRVAPPPTLPTEESVYQRLRAGVQFAWQERSIRAGLAMVAAISLLAACVMVLMPVFAKEVLASGPRVFGLLLGALGVGALAGAVRLAYRRGGAGLRRTIGVAALGAGICAVLFALVDRLELAMIFLALAGFWHVTAVASTNMLIQLNVEDRLRGRVMSLFSIIFIGLQPVGSLFAGALAESVGAPVTVSLFGVMCILSAAAYLRFLRPAVRPHDSATYPAEAAMSTRLIRIGPADELKPGTMRCVQIEGHPVLVANVAGGYYAVDDTCTHEEASLASGSLRGELVKCPLHGSRFSVVTGEVLDEPAEQDLRTYRLKTEDGTLFIEWG